MKFNIIQSLIKNNVINEEEKTIYEYGLFVILFNTLCMIAVLVIGAICHELITSCFFLLSFIPIRILSGGFHLKSPSKCLIFFSSCYFILITIYINLGAINYILTLLIVIIYSISLFIEYKNKLKILIPLYLIVFIECTIFLTNINFAIIQYALIFNTILYFIPKFKIK